MLKNGDYSQSSGDNYDSVIRIGEPSERVGGFAKNCNSRLGNRNTTTHPENSWAALTSFVLAGYRLMICSNCE